LKKYHQGMPFLCRYHHAVVAWKLCHNGRNLVCLDGKNDDLLFTDVGDLRGGANFHTDRVPSVSIRVRPFVLIAASVSPRSTTVTSSPELANLAAKKLPIAPAPITAIFIVKRRDSVRRRGQYSSPKQPAFDKRALWQALRNHGARC
jgi:hypothetical protein